MSILYFPQLANGSLAQYPISRSWSQAVTINTLPDGSTVIMTGPTPPRVAWELSYSGLSEAEWGALQTLFSASQGRYGSFTFLDPTDNLLIWSENPTAAGWTADALLQVGIGIADPLGGSGAATLTNGGQTTQRLMQSLAGPSWFQYCFSIYLRATAACTVDLIQSSTSDVAAQMVNVTSSWARVQAAGILTGQDDGIRFGLELAAGASVFMFGAQVEAQPCAGVYKSKFATSGVYPNSRFDQDTLVQATDTNEQYSTTLQVTATY